MGAASASRLTPRARLLLPIFVAVLIAVSIHRLVCAGEVAKPYAEFSGETMGTTWSVKVAEELDAAARESLADAVQAQLDRVDSLMSTWNPDSELSRFNRTAAREAFPVSPETLRVFEIAREVSRRSGGAFDVTVAPLVAAWGFGAYAQSEIPPDGALVSALLHRVGSGLVETNAATGTLEKLRDDVECDLSGIAKGYAVDLVAIALAEAGHADFLVEVGGELRAQGRRLDGARWRVAIETPDEETRTVHEVLELDGLALATSGDYRNYYEDGGVRVSHTIDPRSGYPIRHNLASVTVVHRETVRADAWATALNVLGPEAGPALAEELDLAAFFIVREEGGAFSSRATTEFEALRAAPEAEQVRELR